MRQRVGYPELIVTGVLQNLRTSLESGRAADIRRIDEVKARHIAALTKAHELAFQVCAQFQLSFGSQFPHSTPPTQEIKSYYNEITHSNLDLIHTLKEELHVLKRKEAADDKLMYDIAQENKRMTEPLKRALADIEHLTAEREAYRCVSCVL
jgi:growth arrest-specific protein 8